MMSGSRARIRIPVLLGSAIAIAALAASCSDPVHDDLVKSLGNDPNPPSEFHRAGQPCVACHGPEGPAQTQFAVAGTVFWHHTADRIGVDQAVVSIIDSLGANPQVVTNCVGNFFIKASDWPGGNGPSFPLRVSVYKDGNPKVMTTQINRAGSCAECHSDPSNYNAVGHVWMVEDSVKTDPLPTDCPLDPNADVASPLPGGL